MLRDATYLSEQIKQKKISSLELLEESLEKIKKLNPKYNAIVAFDEDLARQEIKNHVSTGGLFEGVLMPLKMLGQEHKGLPATASSRLFKDELAHFDDAFTRQIMKAGFIPFGQTNSPEFGFKNITDSALYRDTKNAWNPDYYPGGSSGGAASAVASGMFPIAAASDGGGSIRIPASWSGLIGLKPTRGKMPQGPMSYRGWQGASTSGAMTISVRDTARFLAQTQITQEITPYQSSLLPVEELLNIQAVKRKLKIAFSLQTPISSVEVSQDARLAMKKAVQFLESKGHIVEEVDYPLNARPLIETYYQMNAAETAAMLSPFEKMTGKKLTNQQVEPLTYGLIQAGKNVPATSYIHSLNMWDKANEAFTTKIFNHYDLFLTPTTTKTAIKIGEELICQSLIEKLMHMEEFSLEEQTSILSESFEKSLQYSPHPFIVNLTGQAAISLPIYVNEKTNLPLGVQFMGRKNSEILLLELAKQFEDEGQFILPEVYR
ncbi:MAG: amidase [Streptococcaceae bacterium]|jgi:amidase|nr:amidase [Streptococcaceae bacterium]